MTKITNQQTSGSYGFASTDLGIQKGVAIDRLTIAKTEKALLKRKEANEMGMIGVFGKLTKLFSPLGGQLIETVLKERTDKKYKHEDIKLRDVDTDFYIGESAEFDKISAVIDREEDSARRMKYLTDLVGSVALKAGGDFLDDGVSALADSKNWLGFDLKSLLGNSMGGTDYMDVNNAADVLFS
ncbi:hypothetical protein ACFL4H_00340 [Candidatus Neomarinimicrobiota bacterium]